MEKKEIAVNTRENIQLQKMEASGFIRLIKSISQAKIGLLKLHD